MHPVYTFLASLLERSLIPAVPNKTPAAKSPVFFPHRTKKPPGGGFSYTFFLRFNIVQCEPEFHSHTASPVRQESADEDTPSSPRSHHDHLL